MAKNILIFSDGTGQAGGIKPDQRLSNIYKLYRAARSGPDSAIDPADQVAFYDPGLGTDPDAGTLPFRAYHFLRKLLSSIMGTGISRNIIDCYENIIRVYEPGDRIYLFGFSRGAYTARCVANVLSLCGVPITDKDGQPLRRYGKRLRGVAREAVRSVYEFGAGSGKSESRAAQEELARRFRMRYGSDVGGKANAVPYFIGVFDTVAALGMPKGLRYLVLGAGLGLLGVLYWLIASILDHRSLANYLVVSVVALFSVATASYLLGRLRFIWNFPRPGAFRMTFARWDSSAYDLRLDPDVQYARHALAIDESRRDFSRVGWGRRGSAPVRSQEEGEWLIQLWFSGCHSDIGGSYTEEESRLSDISLDWMLQEVTKVPHPLLYDPDKLHLFPDAGGVQHCEIQRIKDKYPSWWPEGFRLSWPRRARIEVIGAPLHESVLKRFELPSIRDCGVLRAYRPGTLSEDGRLSTFYRDV